MNGTNLDSVKSVAKNFLYLDFTCDKVFPLFVNHPIFEQYLFPSHINGKIDFIDIRTEDGLNKARQDVVKRINDIENVM